MKVLFEYCRQTNKYRDSFGKVLVELEENETTQDVIDHYTKINKEGSWADQKYYNPVEVGEYEYAGKIYKGRLVLLDVQRAYLG